MMSTAPLLLLTSAQATSLRMYLQIYRRHAFTALGPSTTRNTTLRVLQGIQGKLIDLLDQQVDLGQIILTQEESTILKEAVTNLMLLYAQQPESTERNTALVDLVASKNQLKSI